MQGLEYEVNMTYLQQVFWNFQKILIGFDDGDKLQLNYVLVITRLRNCCKVVQLYI